MDQALRNRLWNAIYSIGLFQLDNGNHINDVHPHGSHLAQGIWAEYFAQPREALPKQARNALDAIRKLHDRAEWYEVYDLVEFIAAELEEADRGEFREACNKAMEKEFSAFRFVTDGIAPIVDNAEIDALETAASLKQPYGAAAIHIQQAITHLSDREKPDLRNVIKEAISAVEATCQQITGRPKASLGDALKHIGVDQMHPALNQALDKLYGWTSDADGIRHALSSDATVEFAEAKFMLVTCAAFVNYLVGKAAAR